MDRKEFEAVFPEVLQFLTTEYYEPELKAAAEWFKTALEYVLPTGKKIRAMILIGTFKSFAPKEALTKENLHLAAILGWCIELLEAGWLIIDDCMDQQEYRRGRLCWHKYVGDSIALNDAHLMLNSVYVLLKKYFGNKSYYLDLVNEVVKGSKQTFAGQILETSSSVRNGKINPEYFHKTHVDIVQKYKTSIYSMVLPVALATHLVGSQTIIEKLYTPMVIYGQLFQVQNDYYDCYDTHNVHECGDIQNGTYVWMFATAFDKASPEQRKILLENCGKQGKEPLAKVLKIYEEVNMNKEYEEYMAKTRNRLSKIVEEIKKDTPMHVLDVLHKKLEYNEKFYKSQIEATKIVYQI